MNNAERATSLIKQWSKDLGFEYCGVAKAEFLEEDARRLESWLHHHYHGQMAYMANHFDLRTDPRKLVPGAKSVITLMYNYFPEESPKSSLAKVSKYALGDDYHEIIRPLLRELLHRIQENIGEVQGRGFVDSAPVLERAWAQKSGLGWIGKNANLINKNSGSFFFLATLIVDLPMIYDDPFAGDFCGTCTRCIDACPTGAILSPAVVDGSKCISYLTIELKDELLPQEFSGKMDDWIFGCDVCQDVCPWNRFSSPHQSEALKPNPNLFSFDLNDWLDLEEETFKKIFARSPLKRSKWKGLRRNAHFLNDTKKKN